MYEEVFTIWFLFRATPQCSVGTGTSRIGKSNICWRWYNLARSERCGKGYCNGNGNRCARYVSANGTGIWFNLSLFFYRSGHARSRNQFAIDHWPSDGTGCYAAGRSSRYSTR